MCAAVPGIGLGDEPVTRATVGWVYTKHLDWTSDGTDQHANTSRTIRYDCDLILVSGLAFAQQHNMPAGKMTDEEIIKSAMTAAPEAIGKGATIIDVDSDGKIRVVRQR
jgi:hypothetical protein